MRAIQRVQTVIRLNPEIMIRVKRQAKKENVSFNTFVEKSLEKVTEPSFPKLPPDFKISEEIRALGVFKVPEFTKEKLDSDPKLAYLYNKYGRV